MTDHSPDKPMVYPRSSLYTDLSRIYAECSGPGGWKAGVPDTLFAGSTFDYVHSRTTLEMVRGLFGVEYYGAHLAEIYRILCPGGIFGLGEPMHRDVAIPADLLPVYTKGGGVGPEGWAACFATVAETANLCRGVGFEIVEADHAPDAWDWWMEFTAHDPHCKRDPEGEAGTIRQDGGRWLSYGYVMARKPSGIQDLLSEGKTPLPDRSFCV